MLAASERNKCPQLQRGAVYVTCGNNTASMTSSEKTSPGLGVLTLVLTLLGWSSVPLFLRHFAHSIDFWTSNGWRYGFSALVWLPVLLFVALNGVRGAKGGGLPKGLWKAALVPSIVNAAGQVLFTWAHYRIEPGLVTFGLRTQLLFVAIGAWMLFPAERAVIRRPGYLIGAVILLTGMSAVILMADSERQSDPQMTQTAQVIASDSSHSSSGLASPGDKAAHFQGVALAIGSGLLFASYGLAVRKYMHGVNPVLAFAAICQYTAIAMVVLMLVCGARSGLAVLDLPGDQVFWLLCSALIGIAIGHVFYYFSLARLGVAVTAGVIQLQPFIVALASLWLFGEVLTGWQWAGGTLAVCGATMMLGVQWRLSRQKPKIEEPVAIAEGESGS
jgi:drug/metabolite transporter (DMT)-like permease